MIFYNPCALRFTSFSFSTKSSPSAEKEFLVSSSAKLGCTCRLGSCDVVENELGAPYTDAADPHRRAQSAPVIVPWQVGVALANFRLEFPHAPGEAEVDGHEAREGDELQDQADQKNLQSR